MTIKSGDKAHRTNCDYRGYVYGGLVLGTKNDGVTAPWCPICGLNNCLESIENEERETS